MALIHLITVPDSFTLHPIHNALVEEFGFQFIFMIKCPVVQVETDFFGGES